MEFVKSVKIKFPFLKKKDFIYSEHIINFDYNLTCDEIVIKNLLE